MYVVNLIMFCKVVEVGSVSEVARLSFISQPAVTKQVRQLEEYYGTELFDRSNGRLSLTKSGCILYEYAKEIISLTSQSEEVIKQSIGKNESAIAIGASYTIGEYLLPQVLGDFQKSHRNIKFSLSIGNTPNIISELENNNVHIALVEGIVENNELILVGSHDQPWNKKQEIEIADIASEKMIWREENSGDRKIIENTLSEYNKLDKIKSRMELGSTQAIKSAVEANLGIAILPK